MAVGGRRNPALTAAKYLAIAGYVAFALFPLYWLVKIAMTPNGLIFTEGTRMWPSATTWDNFAAVLRSDFLQFFRNSVVVSLLTAAITSVIAAGGGYAFSRFQFRGKRLVAALLLLTQMFPVLMIIAPIYRIMGEIGLRDTLTGLIVIYTAFNIPSRSS
jgi:multiple sugar transport system permease protein